MLERFLKKTKFESFDDFMQHYEVCVPEHFNFAYDVVDAWAEQEPEKRALVWCDDQGNERTLTFSDIRRISNHCALDNLHNRT